MNSTHRRTNPDNHSAYRTRIKPTAHLRSLDAQMAAATAVLQPTQVFPGLGPGSTGKLVKYAQQHLSAAGYAVSPSGDFGAQTVAQVEAFQKHNGLPVTGRVDAATWGKLKGAYLYANSAANPPQAVGEKDAFVKKNEQVLGSLGYRVRSDGLYDNGTRKAVDTFQRRHHLKVTGTINNATEHVLKVDARALNNPKLKLVREIAEMAKRDGVPAEIPIMTALVESNFSNPAGGDRDSVGMFQQRAAWGPYSVRHNPLASAKLFFHGGDQGQPGAMSFIGRYRHLGPAAYGAWCQSVQVSAFPDRYQQRLGEARQLLREAGVNFGLAKD